MITNNSTTRLAKFSLVIGVILSACSPAPAINGGQILVSPDTNILLNGQATLKIDVVVQGASPEFIWTAERGAISNANAPSVIYTAPATAGPDIVTVVVTAGKTTFTQTTTFNVVELPPTQTPTATAVPTPENTPTPALPIVCNLPPVTKNLFPELSEVTGQYPIYGPLTEANFFCEGVYDIVHNEPLAVHIKYTNVGTNFGWWGVATPNGYDASHYSQICFWAYALEPNQSFRLKMKDTTRKEQGVIVTIEAANEWNQICTNLSKFSDLGVQVAKMDNINLGFEKTTGSAEVWLADFEFK